MGTDSARLSLKTQALLRSVVANLPADIQIRILQSKAMFESYNQWFEHFKLLVTTHFPVYGEDSDDIDDMWNSNIAFSLFNLFSLTLFYCYPKDHVNIYFFFFYNYLKDGLLLKIRPNQTKPSVKPEPTYSLTYYDPCMISHV